MTGLDPANMQLEPVDSPVVVGSLLTAALAADLLGPDLDAPFDEAGAARAALPYWLVRTMPAAELRKFREDQQRDPDGKWGDGIAGPSTISSLTGQAALDATPAKLVGSGYPPRHEKHRPGGLQFTTAGPDWSAGQRRARVAALEGYQGEDFRTINRSLRGMLTDDRYLEDYASSSGVDLAHAREHLDRQVDLIDDVMNVSVLADDIRVLRGTQTGRGVFGDRLAGDLTGFEWTEAAYVSTTADSDVGDFTSTGLSMEIVVPAGTKAVNLSGFTTATGAGDEAEILLERGLRMRVVSDTGPGDPRHLEVEVVNGRGE